MGIDNYLYVSNDNYLYVGNDNFISSGTKSIWECRSIGNDASLVERELEFFENLFAVDVVICIAIHDVLRKLNSGSLIYILQNFIHHVFHQIKRH